MRKTLFLGKAMSRTPFAALIIALAACQPPTNQPAPTAPKPKDVSGSAMINVAPKTDINLVGTLDFDLLGAGVGKGCASEGDDTIYWVGLNDLAALGPDKLSRRAIAAAALD